MNGEHWCPLYFDDCRDRSRAGAARRGRVQEADQRLQRRAARQQRALDSGRTLRLRPGQGVHPRPASSSAVRWPSSRDCSGCSPRPRSSWSRRSCCSSAPPRTATSDGLPGAAETAMAKFAANQAGFAAADVAMQAMGATGFCERQPRRVLLPPHPRLDDRRRVDRDPEEPHRRARLRPAFPARGRAEVTAAALPALFAPAAVALVGASDVRGKATARPLEFLRRHGVGRRGVPGQPGARDRAGRARLAVAARRCPRFPSTRFVLTAADARGRCGARVRRARRRGRDRRGRRVPGRRRATATGAARELREILEGSALRLLGPSSLGVAALGARAGADRQRRVRRASASGGRRLRRLAVRQRARSAALARAPRWASASPAWSRRATSSTSPWARSASPPSTTRPSRASRCSSRTCPAPSDLRRLRAWPPPSEASRSSRTSSGRSDAGARLSVSHTGALAGDDAVADAFFGAHGIARVHDLRRRCSRRSCSRGGCRCGVPRPRPASRVVSTTGGGGAMAVDCLAGAGVDRRRAERGDRRAGSPRSASHAGHGAARRSDAGRHDATTRSRRRSTSCWPRPSSTRSSPCPAVPRGSLPR